MEQKMLQANSHSKYMSSNHPELNNYLQGHIESPQKLE
jgi:hypothetical protein